MTATQKELIKANSNKCIGKTGVDEALVQKVLRDNVDVRDDAFNHYLFCTMNKSGLISDDGVINKEAHLANIDNEVVKQIHSKAIDACLVETGATKEEKAFNFFKCYRSQNFKLPKNWGLRWLCLSICSDWSFLCMYREIGSEMILLIDGFMYRINRIIIESKYMSFFYFEIFEICYKAQLINILPLIFVFMRIYMLCIFNLKKNYFNG